MTDHTAGRPSPYELWTQAAGDRERYRALLLQHGHLIPLKPGETRQPLPCGWPDRRVTDHDDEGDTVEQYRLDEGKVTGSGIMADATGKHHADLPEHDGRHTWVVTGLWRVDNPARSNHNLDMENLLSVDGPGCLHCEQPWKPTIGSKCPGEPRE